MSRIPRSQHGCHYPTGTILCHGRQDDRVPEAPDWLAFDFEHAYMLCTGPCYVVSVQTKRELRLLYFDGPSAAKMEGGSHERSGHRCMGKTPA